MMVRYIAAGVALVALGLCPRADSQVVRSGESDVPRTVKATRTGGQTEVAVSVLPATVRLAADREDRGWFLVVTDPAQHLFWWRFQAGTYEAGSSFPADEFAGSCRVHVAPGQLAVFCTTARHLLIGVSERRYPDPAAIPGLVRAEFDGRAARLDTGFDYFDKAVNLWPILGSDFFFEPGRSDSITGVDLRSVSRAGDRWEVVVGGAGKAAAKLTLGADFSVLESARLP
jgi:hypothetical protein